VPQIIPLLYNLLYWTASQPATYSQPAITDMLLKDRRDSLRLSMLYKIVSNLVEIDSCGPLIRNDAPTRGQSKRFKQAL